MEGSSPEGNCSPSDLALDPCLEALLAGMLLLLLLFRQNKFPCSLCWLALACLLPCQRCPLYLYRYFHHLLDLAHRFYISHIFCEIDSLPGRCFLLLPVGSAGVTPGLTRSVGGSATTSESPLLQLIAVAVALTSFFKGDFVCPPLCLRAVCKQFSVASCASEPEQYSKLQIVHISGVTELWVIPALFEPLPLTCLRMRTTSLTAESEGMLQLKRIKMPRASVHTG